MFQTTNQKVYSWKCHRFLFKGIVKQAMFDWRYVPLSKNELKFKGALKAY